MTRVVELGRLDEKLLRKRSLKEQILISIFQHVKRQMMVCCLTGGRSTMPSSVITSGGSMLGFFFRHRFLTGFCLERAMLHVLANYKVLLQRKRENQNPTTSRADLLEAERAKLMRRNRRGRRTKLDY